MGAIMKRALLVTFAAAFASACVVTSALADVSFTDPAGDAADAPDVTAVTVSNDTGGNILFHVTVANFTPESRVVIYLDTDKNASTGEDGSEYLLRLDRSADPAIQGWGMGQWNGTDWVDAAQYSTVVVASGTTMSTSVSTRAILAARAGSVSRSGRGGTWQTP